MLIHRHTHEKYNTRNRRNNTILLLIIILIIIRRIHNYNNSNTNTCQTQLWPLPALTTSSIARRTAGPTTDQARTCFSACAAALASASSRACAHTDSHTTESRAQCTWNSLTTPTMNSHSHECYDDKNETVHKLKRTTMPKSKRETITILLIS